MAGVCVGGCVLSRTSPYSCAPHAPASARALTELPATPHAFSGGKGTAGPLFDARQQFTALLTACLLACAATLGTLASVTQPNVAIKCVPYAPAAVRALNELSAKRLASSLRQGSAGTLFACAAAVISRSPACLLACSQTRHSSKRHTAAVRCTAAPGFFYRQRALAAVRARALQLLFP